MGPVENKATVTHSIWIAHPPEEVWDFTQDYARRPTWDSTVLDAEVLRVDPVPRVRVRCAGGLRAVFQYRQFDRPSRTSLAMEEVRSPLVVGGGGAWSYEARDGGTVWTQTNTLVLRPGGGYRVILPLVRWQLGVSTRRAMERVKRELEGGG